MLITTEDGSHSIFSEKYGVSYHSKFGAIQETQHVFIDAGLRFKAVVQKDIGILETGFGTGLNALMTALEARRRNLTIHYTTYELFPIDNAAVEALNYTEQLPTDLAISLFPRLHDCPWEEPVVLEEDFVFEKKQHSFSEIEDEEAFDLIYFDAFAPTAQPELWTEEVLNRMYRALKPDGILTTYCAQGEMKRRLKRAGFTVERLKGPPGKREMTRAIKLLGGS